MNLVAVLAFFQGMACQERLQMLFLFGRKSACSSAQRTSPIQHADNRLADELGTVWDTLKPLPEAVIHFESDYFLFWVFHFRAPASSDLKL